MSVVASEASSKTGVRTQCCEGTGPVIGRAGFGRIESEDSTLGHGQVSFEAVRFSAPLTPIRESGTVQVGVPVEGPAHLAMPTHGPPMKDLPCCGHKKTAQWRCVRLRIQDANPGR
ncbi:hypothetical protein FQZ97_734520 [compost metagenome]